MQHRRATAASMFQNGISRNTKCDIIVGFPKSSHILYAHTFNKVYIANDLTVLRHIMGYNQNVSTEIPEGSKLCNTFGTNERVHLITLRIPTADN